MQTRRLLFFTFGAIIILAFLHGLAIWAYLYWTVWWFDTMMHFLGGFSIALFALWFSYKAGALKSITSKTIISCSLVSVLAVGVGWEIFEYVNDIAGSPEDYSRDTSNDLIADLVGAFLAGIVVVKGKLLHD